MLVGISAHPNGQTIVTNEPFRGKTLGVLWEQHPELFGHFPADRFPLLTKILDANADLSVQVHPNDEYARTYEHGELGKTECWYIIDCKDGAELIYGHYAKTKEELRQMMEEGRWHDLLRKVPIRPGDFFMYQVVQYMRSVKERLSLKHNKTQIRRIVYMTTIV